MSTWTEQIRDAKFRPSEAYAGKLYPFRLLSHQTSCTFTSSPYVDLFCSSSCWHTQNLLFLLSFAKVTAQLFVSEYLAGLYFCLPIFWLSLSSHNLSQPGCFHVFCHFLTYLYYKVLMKNQSFSKENYTFDLESWAFLGEEKTRLLHVWLLSFSQTKARG